MWRIPSTCAILVATALVVLSWSDAAAQRRSSYGGRINTQRLVRRIEELERRVTALERIRHGQKREEIVLSADVPITVESAQQQLSAARQRQAFSEKLFGKGYVSEAEMEADRFEAARARKVLQFAEAARDGQPTETITRELRILEAENDLAVARRRLRLAEALTAKGLAGSNLPAHRKAVEDAQRQLDEQKQP